MTRSFIRAEETKGLLWSMATRLEGEIMTGNKVRTARGKSDQQTSLALEKPASAVLGVYNQDCTERNNSHSAGLIMMSRQESKVCTKYITSPRLA